MRITVHTYCPTAVSSLFTAHSSLAALYAFSAKERDVETGLSYFGARYYSSDLSIWLSVDPMSDKYPSLSPYTYCANNPVKLVDPNGEDYEVVVDDATMTITIRAQYYVTHDTYDKVAEAIQYIKAQEGWLNYNAEDGQTYSIKFDLTIAGTFDTRDDAEKASSNGEDPSISNICSIGQTMVPANESLPAFGQTEAGRVITIRDKNVSVRSYMHEIGHTLGLGEWTGLLDLMTPEGEGIFLSNRSVQQIMSRAGAGQMPEFWPGTFDNPNMEKSYWQNIGKGKLTK